MTYCIDIKDNDSVKRFYLKNYPGYQRIFVDNIVCMDIVMYSYHKYTLNAYFFKDRIIIGTNYYRTKKELYGAIQNYLQKFL